uniref:Uncharacterized protein n=1 Tax=Oryza nivara TaxID=4536 RepID=A0A0E0GXB4_ORYNI
MSDQQQEEDLEEKQKMGDQQQEEDQNPREAEMIAEAPVQLFSITQMCHADVPRGVARARSGVRIILKKPFTSVKSTPPVAATAVGAHSNSRTSAATKRQACATPSPMPGQYLRPAPNGIILTSLGPGSGPTPSASPPAMNLSGRNSSGSVHALPSRPMSPRMKCTRAPPSGRERCSTACGERTSRMVSGTGGCMRRLSRITARRYAGVVPRSPPWWSAAATTWRHSLSWISGSMTRCARVHSTHDTTVSVPPLRNSATRPTISSSVSARPELRPSLSSQPAASASASCPTGTRRSSSEST